MFSFIATVISLAWIREHLVLVLAVLAVLIALIVFLVIRSRKRRRAYLALPVLFIGNRSTRTYHASGCPQLARINRANLVAIRTQQDVARGRFSPCGTCRPVWPEK